MQKPLAAKVQETVKYLRDSGRVWKAGIGSSPFQPAKTASP